MKKSDTQKLLKLVGTRFTTPEWQVRVERPVPTRFHQWADDKLSLANLVTTRVSDGVVRNLLLTAWRGTAVWYVVVFPESRDRPLAELHDLNGGRDERYLEWRYQPIKRDGRNRERVEYFTEQFGSPVVHVGLPNVTKELESFLEDLFALVDNRLAADDLAADRPSNDDRFPEGRLLERRHLARERNRALIAKAKALRKGRLRCEVCAFDFKKVYGRHGDGYIEAHHTKPVSELTETSTTRVEDIALVCANCHRMLHRRRPWLELRDLKQLLARRRA